MHENCDKVKIATWLISVHALYVRLQHTGFIQRAECNQVDT